MMSEWKKIEFAPSWRKGPSYTCQTMHKGTKKIIRQNLKTVSYLGDSQYIFWSTSSDEGLFALVGGNRIKNKISYLARIGGKNKKDALKLVFYHENRQIPYDLSTFLIKIPLFFLHVGGKIKKNLNCPFFSCWA